MVNGMPVGSSDTVPPQKLTVFGMTVFERVGEARLPRFPLPQQPIRLPEETLGFDEADLHNGEMLRLSQVLYNAVASGLNVR